jgi:hypothetical protein
VGPQHQQHLHFAETEATAAAGAWGGQGRNAGLGGDRQRTEGLGAPGLSDGMQHHHLPGTVPSPEPSGNGAVPRLHTRKSNLGAAAVDSAW